MKVALGITLFLVCVGFVLWLVDRLSAPRAEDNTSSGECSGDAGAASDDGDGCTVECCTLNEVCPGEMSLRNATEPPVYYDDDELDAFRGREADDYSADEVEQFRDVLYTLQPAELFAWEKSVKKRGITLPREIKDEFVMLYNEHRGEAHTQ